MEGSSGGSGGEEGKVRMWEICTMSGEEVQGDGVQDISAKKLRYMELG